MAHHDIQRVLYAEGTSPLWPFTRSQECRGAWDRQQARFEECFLPIISLIPGILAIGVLAVRVSWPLILRRPLWLRDFVGDGRKGDVSPTSSSTETKQGFPSRTLLLLAICSAGLLLDLAGLLWPPNDMLLLIPTISWATVILLLLIDRPSYAPLSPLWILLTIFATQLLFHLNTTKLITVSTIPGILSTMTALVAIVHVLHTPLRDPSAPSPSTAVPFATPSHEYSSPEDNLTPWQFMSVAWMSPLISLGSKRQLEGTDVWALPLTFQHKELHNRFRDLKGSVIRKLLQANGLDLCILTLIALLDLVLRFCAPALLQLLLRSLEDENAGVRAAVVYASIALLVRLTRAQMEVFETWYGRRCYERSRGELITMLHEKVLARKIIGATAASEKAENDDEDKKTKGNEKENDKPASMGKIFNLMKYDAYEVAQRFWEWENLIDTPLGLIVSVVLVWQMIGWPALFGVITVIIAQVLNAGVTRLLLRWEKVRRSATDTRLQQSSQYVEAIRHLRWYGWQDHWLEGILKARSKELRERVKTSLLRVVIDFNNAAGGYLFPVAAFYAYTSWAGLPLRLDIAFPALQLFNYLEWYLMDVPALITTLLNARIAVGRIEAFMNEPDVEEDGNDMVTVRDVDDGMIEIEQANFAWPAKQDAVLRDISLKFATGMTVILGEVGSGKTALLQAILGEMDTLSGHVTKPSSMMGYCAQTPWLQSMSIKDNILFSYPFEEERYKQVLATCQLNQDLDTFVDGDRSLIGENGIGLSGGQRARVALARAVYSRSKILILDDPLSALDHQTADAIVKKCFRGSLMDGRTLILVTHRVELVQHLAEQLVEVSEGTARILDPTTNIGNLVRTRTNASTESTEERKDAKKEDEDAKAAEKFIEDEKRVHGGVKARVYWEYIKAGKVRYWILFLVTMAALRGIGIGFSYFLKEWSEAYDDRPSIADIVSDVFNRFPSPNENVSPWLWAFLWIAVIRAALYTSMSVVGVVLTYTAGREMFTDVVKRVSGATFRFYDVTPVGRLMNRLTADMGTVDGGLSSKLRMIIIFSIQWIGAVIVIASVTPVFLVFSILLSLTFVLIFRHFLPPSQSLRRLEMVSLSPLMSNFGALLHGLTTVRAFKSQSLFQSRVISVTDEFQKQDHFFWSLQAWLSYRFDALSGLSNFVLLILALYTGVTPGLTAFLLNSATQYVGATHALCKRYGQLQMDFVSVERIVELLHLEQEPPGSVLPPAAWPPIGASISFTNVTLSYASNLPPALKNISLDIPGGRTTALIGRTGSGKSTLALSLLSTLPPPSTGSITLADLDVTTVNTHALRQRITFLAQDPVLFPGTIRHNLDPLNLHTDDECAAVLARVAPESKHHFTLSTAIEQGGTNLSQGQRQLIGLARAVLRRSSVVIMDEATASIDADTAGEVLRILREELVGATVLVVAHRVEGVRGADWWVRLDEGRVAGQGRVVNGKMVEETEEEDSDDGDEV